MALTPCPECNAAISTEAASCPQCGYTLRAAALHLIHGPQAVFVRKPRAFGIIVGLCFIGVGMWILAVFIPEHTLSAEYVAKALAGEEPGILSPDAVCKWKLAAWLLIVCGVIDLAFWGHRTERVA